MSFDTARFEEVFHNLEYEKEMQTADVPQRVHRSKYVDDAQFLMDWINDHEEGNGV